MNSLNFTYGIKCCHYCKSRYLGCHANCSQYQKEKAQFEINKVKAKANINKIPKIPKVGKHGFDMLACTHKRHK